MHETDEESDFTREDTWRIFRIMAEFVEGFDELNHLGPAVTIFGSARTKPDDPYYAECVKTARLLGEAGFTAITFYDGYENAPLVPDSPNMVVSARAAAP